MKHKILTILCSIACVGLLVALIWETIFIFQHPDMTDMRLMIEYPYPIILAVISSIIVIVVKDL